MDNNVQNIDNLFLNSLYRYQPVFCEIRCPHFNSILF